jgi:glutamate racemase
MNKQPIGIFDSGIGGLTVLKPLVRYFPNESFVYYGDSGNCPYGEKSKTELFKLVTGITNFLIGKNCKIIVVACNTITTNLISELRSLYAVPFIGMEPGLKPASLHSKTGKIGVLATKGTINGDLFKTTLDRFAMGVEVYNQIGYGLVDLIEKNQIDTPEMEALLRKYIEPMLAHNIDHLVLGCTHYPFLTSAIAKITGSDVHIVETSEAIAKQVERILNQENILAPAGERDIHIYTSGDLHILSQIINRLEIHETKIERFTILN